MLYVKCFLLRVLDCLNLYNQKMLNPATYNPWYRSIFSQCPPLNLFTSAKPIILVSIKLTYCASGYKTISIHVPLNTDYNRNDLCLPCHHLSYNWIWMRWDQKLQGYSRIHLLFHVPFAWNNLLLKRCHHTYEKHIYTMFTRDLSKLYWHPVDNTKNSIF